MKLRIPLTLALGLFALALAAPQVDAMRQEGILPAIQAYSAMDDGRLYADGVSGGGGVTGDGGAPAPVVTTTAPVTAAGGRVPVAGGSQTPGGAGLDIPPGAIGSNTNLTLSVTNAAPEGVQAPSGSVLLGKTIEITLENPQALKKTVELLINVSDLNLQGKDLANFKVGVIINGVVELRPTRIVDAAKGILSVTLDHFTKFTVFEVKTPGPTLTAPADRATLPGMGTTLMWTNTTSPAQTQYHLQVVPFNGDGAAVNIIGNITNSFVIPEPPVWYGMLPDTTYFWRVRTTFVTTEPLDFQWSSWATGAFRTAKASSSTVSLVSPTEGSTVTSLTPTLAWSNSNPAVFYYEVQVSKDAAYGANAFLYGELRHGGVTSPPNSYTIPAAFPLEAGAAYYWRVRPRVQGDAAPLDWPASYSFKTPGGTPAATPTPAPGPAATPTPAPTPAPTPGPDDTPPPDDNSGVMQVRKR